MQNQKCSQKFNEEFPKLDRLQKAIKFYCKCPTCQYTRSLDKTTPYDYSKCQIVKEWDQNIFEDLQYFKNAPVYSVHFLEATKIN